MIGMSVNTCKTWEDQPDEIEGLPILLDTKIDCPATKLAGTEHTQIRKDKLGRYYLTFGNLFGSETQFFDHVDDLFSTLNEICQKTHASSEWVPAAESDI
tara:strand:- start:609 stop:908 length:300 start_codon:yes stop_codon:yes gene_type:complete